MNKIDWNDPTARKAYDREYQHNRRNIRNKQKAERRRLHKTILTEWKISYGCVDCGYNNHPEALDFDHVNGKKLGNLSEMVNHGASLDTLVQEILKCEVVCANCHRIRTYLRRGRKESAMLGT